MTPFFRLRVLSNTCRLRILKLRPIKWLKTLPCMAFASLPWQRNQGPDVPAENTLCSRHWSTDESSVIKTFQMDDSRAKFFFHWFRLLFFSVCWYRIKTIWICQILCYWHRRSRGVKWYGSEKLSCRRMFPVVDVLILLLAVCTAHHQHPVCRDVAAATPLTMQKTTDNHMTSAQTHSQYVHRAFPDTES